MARGRMLSKTLSTSQKYARLCTVMPKLAEFAQLMYPLLVAHADDFGRLAGDPFTVKHAVVPTSPRKLVDVEAALNALHQVGLITWYEADSRRIIQIEQFDEHQIGLKRRAVSGLPQAGESLNASERDVEEYIAQELLARRLVIGDLAVVTVDRQVRVGNSYLDIVAKTSQGLTIVVEVKRQRVTRAALDQVLGYIETLADDLAVPVVIGHGLAAGLDIVGSGVLIGTYGDDLVVTTVASLDVKSRHLTLSHVSHKRTEEKGTEQNRTELNRREPAAPLQLVPESVDEFVCSWNDVVTVPIPVCKGISDQRREKIRARLKERPLVEWRAIFQRIEASAFCHGHNDRKWVMSLDWLIKNDEHALRVLEGKYDDRRAAKASGEPREAWDCRHADRCNTRAMCENKKLLPEKYPERQAS